MQAALEEGAHDFRIMDDPMDYSKMYVNYFTSDTGNRRIYLSEVYNAPSRGVAYFDDFSSVIIVLLQGRCGGKFLYEYDGSLLNKDDIAWLKYA